MPQRRTVSVWTFVLLFGSSLVLNAALAKRVSSQAITIRVLTAQKGVALGASVGPLKGKDGAGLPVTVDVAAAGGTVLYVYAPTCHWCERNLENMRSVVTAAAGRGFAVYAVSLVEQDADSFLRSRGVTVPVIVPSDGTRVEYSLGGTPQTIVVGRDGRVLRSWQGAYTGKNAAEISEYFQVTLPGLLDAPSR
jgi:peroxiredoxin